jgi:two-component system, NarL family, sensor kinase
MPTQNKELIITLVISAILLVVILSYFIYTIIKEHRKVSAWQQERIKAEIQTLEGERKRIAGDLHDELGPLLSAIKMQMNHIEPNTDEEKNLMQKNNGQIDMVMKRFREISYDLMPNTLVRRGVIKASEEFVNRLSGLNGMKIKIEHSGDIKLNPDQELNLFRMVQEISHNALKHSKASLLTFNIQKQNKFVHFSSTDNGTGFEYQEKSSTSKGLGLMNLQSRAEILGSSLNVETAPGKGTKYSIQIPIVNAI